MPVLTPNYLQLRERESGLGAQETDHAGMFVQDGRLWSVADTGLIYPVSGSISASNAIDNQDIYYENNAIAPVDRLKVPAKSYTDYGDGTLDIGATPLPDCRKWFSWSHNLIAPTTYECRGIGIANLTVSGSYQGSNYRFNQGGWYRRMLGLSGSGSKIGVITASFDLVRLAHNPSFEIPISISATTSVRFWVGLTSAAFAHAAVPTTACIAFRFDSGFDSGQWKGVVSDGTNYSITSGLGAAVTGANRNLLQMRTDGSTVYFRFNGGAEASLNTNLPLTTTDLGLEICLQHNGNNSRELGLCNGIVMFN